MSEDRSEWKSRIALLLGGITLAVLLAEIGLRLAGIEYPIFSRPDDERGWALRPGAKGQYSAEGGSPILINSDGWRDREHSREKPAGTLRIAVLGDSFVEAREVSMEDTFWSVLERELSARSPKESTRIEVLSFGVRGYGTAQELLTLRCCVWDYHPDVVLLAFHPGNDVADNSRALDQTSTSYARPYFIGTPKGWSVDRSFRTGFRYRLSKLLGAVAVHSRIAQLQLQARHVRIRESARGPATDGGIPAALKVAEGAYREPGDSAWKDAWLTTENLVRTIAREVHARGAGFGLVLINGHFQVFPDSVLRDRFARRFGMDFGFPSRRIQQVADQEHFAVLDLAPPFREYADRHQAFLHGFGNRQIGMGHWNELGHRLAGERIGSWLGDWLPYYLGSSSGMGRPAK